jgi:pilus assembly protein CpaB
MNTSRVVILGAAALAAGAAAFLARGLLGGGTEKVKAAALPPPVTTSEVLVATDAIQAGAALTPASVRWQVWPKSSVDSSFITHEEAPDVNRVVSGVVAREPLVAGEPLTASKIVHADGAGFMAAMVTPGMRAVSIGVSTESGAGGFILPNDRVDVLVTGQVSETPRRFGAKTILSDVRVLAVDQTYKEDKDQKVVLAKTATLELSPKQAELVEMAQAAGTISLALRALGDSGLQDKTVAAGSSGQPEAGPVYIIRYGVVRPAGEQRE